jgi:beta-glucosidase
MSKKASDLVKYYQNENGPVIGTVNRNVICQDGLYFKDIDGSGVMKDYNDWRLPPKQRAESYVKQLSVKEKIGQRCIPHLWVCF